MRGTWDTLEAAVRAGEIACTHSRAAILAGSLSLQGHCLRRNTAARGRCPSQRFRMPRVGRSSDSRATVKAGLLVRGKNWSLKRTVCCSGQWPFESAFSEWLGYSGGAVPDWDSVRIRHRSSLFVGRAIDRRFRRQCGRPPTHVQPLATIVAARGPVKWRGEKLARTPRRS